MTLEVFILLFMVGNLLDMGLRLEPRRAVAGLRDLRFVALTLVWGFLLCPALAWLLTQAVPMDPPYAMGLILLGMAPCAPLLPMVASKAGGDLGYTAAFMLLVAVVTVAYMPIATPILLAGLSTDAWTIAKPLVAFILVPLAIGTAIRSVAGPLAARLSPWVTRATGVITLVTLVWIMVAYWRGFLGAVGSYAIVTQLLFVASSTFAPYWLGFGMPRDQRSVLALGMSTRNLGAAVAPLIAVDGVDQRAIVMVALGMPVTLVVSLAAARWFGRRPR